MPNVKTVTITGGEVAVKFDRNYPYFWVQNLGDSDVYLSTSPGIVPDADGVMLVSPKCGRSSGDVGQTDTLYLSGSGKVEITPQFNAVCPFFKYSGEGGESGDSVDLTAYLPKKLPDVYMSAGTKTMKQVCDEIKSWWSENYNNFSVFRFLGGFESDVVDGWNSNKFLGSGYTWQLTPINNYFNTADNGTFILSAIATSDSILVYIVGLHSKAWAAPKKIVTGELTDEDIAKLDSITPEMIEKLKNL